MSSQADSDLLAIFIIFAIWQTIGTLRLLHKRKKADEAYRLILEHPFIPGGGFLGEELIEGAGGRDKELQGKIMAALAAKEIPDTITEKITGRFRDMECSVLSIKNRFDIYGRMLLAGMDYGSYLDVRWLYVSDKPDRDFTMWGAWVGTSVCDFLDKRADRRRDKILNADKTRTLGTNNIEKWKQMIGIIIAEEIRQMREEQNSSFSEQTKESKGFINFS